MQARRLPLPTRVTALRQPDTWPANHLADPETGQPVPFHPGQQRALDSPARFVFVLAGTQGGKTSFGPWWLAREIDHLGGGDYLAVTATFDLFKLKMLPVMRLVFETILKRGRYWASSRVMELADPQGRFHAQTADDPMWGRIILRSAESGGGLESATVKAAWLDECGQESFVIGTWEAVLRRLSLSQGRVLGTTTLYNHGWLKAQVYDRWAARESDYEVVQFDSHINPRFPQAEYDRAERDMPGWKFHMFYRGEYDRPPGMIYDSFNESRCVIEPFAIPDKWPRYGGLDFGGVNTAALCFAENPANKRLYAFQEYLEGGKTAAGHSKDLAPWDCALWVGGSHSEGQWRQEFRAAGLPVNEPPINDVEVGIDRVYGCHARNEIFVFKTLTRYLAEKRTYSREPDTAGQPTEKIRDKNSFHILDAERYIISQLRDTTPKPLVGITWI